MLPPSSGRCSCDIQLLLIESCGIRPLGNSRALWPPHGCLVATQIGRIANMPTEVAEQLEELELEDEQVRESKEESERLRLESL